MNRPDEPDSAERAPQGPSKSQLKRDAQALQALGETLVALPAAQLAQVPLTEALREAIEQCRRITAHGGRYRQLQYIGKLMRGIDPAPIRAVLARFDATSAEARRRQHQVERWVEALVAGDEAVLGAFFDAHPHVDRQHLRTLARNAARELAAGKPPKARRELFRCLRDAAFGNEPFSDA